MKVPLLAGLAAAGRRRARTTRSSCGRRRRPRRSSDVGAAVQEALRFPLAGPAARAAGRRRGGRVDDRRRAARAADPERAARPAAGRARRGRRRARARRRPARASDAARRRRPARSGRAAASSSSSFHPSSPAASPGGSRSTTSSDPDLVELGVGTAGVPLRVNPALVETDARRRRHRRRDGAPRRPGGAPRRVRPRSAPRRRCAYSLLETAGVAGLAPRRSRSSGALPRRVPVIGGCAHAQPSGSDRRVPRLPARRPGARADRRLAGPLACSGWRPARSAAACSARSRAS